MPKRHAPELYKPKHNWLVERHQKAVLAARGVDPALVADELGITERTVRMIQRKLGLRKCMNQRNRRDRHAAIID